MKAAVLIKNANPEQAFDLREMPNPVPKANEVLVAVQAFGLNFADVVAMRGQYQDCPPLPTVIGYEVVGTVEQLGEGVTHVALGDRVVAFTRFGAYATKVVARSEGVVKIPDSNTMSNGVAAALATQYCTAYYAACVAINLQKHDHVLIHAAAGGVGTALVQLALAAGCTVYGTVGSEEKISLITKQGVHHAINYNKRDFVSAIKELAPNGKVDVIFDAVGGASVRKGMGLLASGGRMVCYGAASMSQKSKNIFKTIKSAAGFGIYHPAQFMMRSISLIGVNMLRIADNRPQILQHCLQQVTQLAANGVLKPIVGGVFPIKELPDAINKLENRQTVGKIVVEW